MIQVRWADPTDTKGQITPSASRSIRSILKECADKHGISYDEIVSNRRQRNLVIARQEAMWRCKAETTATYPQIAMAIGHRDHTTILHGVRQHEKRMSAQG